MSRKSQRNALLTTPRSLRPQRMASSACQAWHSSTGGRRPPQRGIHLILLTSARSSSFEADVHKTPDFSLSSGAVGVLFSDTLFNDTLGLLALGNYSDTRVDSSSSRHRRLEGRVSEFLPDGRRPGLNGRQGIHPDYALYDDRTDDRRKNGRVVL